MKSPFPTLPRVLLSWLLLISTVSGFADSIQVEDTYRPVDTQPEGQPLAPNIAVEKFNLPPGFQITLAASEPAVRQPIAICHDDRGRLWVAESYSYGGSKFTDEAHDRILILEDRDGDGVYDSRKIFKDNLNRLTSLVWGFGGVWVTTAPYLAFIPDRDGDDQPDSEPEIHLDGWTLVAEHNSVNGLSWGPDGWLYGRHGIKAPSRPGRPETPVEQRPEISCSIWRYHPVRHDFEVVSEGTVNPWGLDYDDYGQMFITSSVVDHLWHVVPGSHFLRSPHAENHPFLYDAMGPTSDHSHRPKALPKSAQVPTLESDDGGGGHSHVGMMFYLGGRWPAAYRNGLYLQNLLGHRINHERMERDPQTDRFVARHGPDFLTVDDPWFRGVSLEYGPDGDVVVTDWSDEGECHDRDGVSRSTGRIYKVSWGKPRKVESNLEKLEMDELVALQSNTNDWYVRHSRRMLQEKAASGLDMSDARRSLMNLFTSAGTVPVKLRALWALHAIREADEEWLIRLLDYPEENIRFWATRLLVDSGAPSKAACRALAQRGESENAWLARMALASSLGELDAENAWKLGKALATQVRNEDDHNLVCLIWSGWQSHVMAHYQESIPLVSQLANRRLRQWIARRVVAGSENPASLVNDLLFNLTPQSSAEFRTDIFEGIEAGLQKSPASLSANSWSLLRDHYQYKNPATRHAALLLGAKLEDNQALDELRQDLKDQHVSTDVRKRMLRALVSARPPWLLDELLQMTEQLELVEPVIRAMAGFNDRRVVTLLLRLYSDLNKFGRQAIVDTLLERADTANALMDAIEAGNIPKSAISAFQARQIQGLSDPGLSIRLENLWGHTNPSPEAIASRIKDLRMILKDQAFMRDADIASGRQTFEQRCMTCHSLFDRGGKLGPDLTGSGRHDLDYLLINVLDPNASILANWRLTVVTLEDGRVLSGTIVADRPQSIDILLPDGVTSIDRSQIKSLDRINSSLMPAGLLDDMSAQQIRDLFAFLMSDTGPADSL